MWFAVALYGEQETGPPPKVGRAGFKFSPRAVQAIGHKDKQMSDVLTYGLLLVGLIGLGVLVYPYVLQLVASRKTLPYQGVVKRDWLPTGRIDFATHIKADAMGGEQPSEFKLLVEERRIVESVAGNENLEIQWRLATLKEAKAVITHYHRYLSENSLVKTHSESPEPSHSMITAQDSATDTSQTSLGSDTKEGSVG